MAPYLVLGLIAGTLAFAATPAVAWLSVKIGAIDHPNDRKVHAKPTPTLGGLGRAARARALSGAIAVNSRRQASLKGASVVLVDDVMTSGATSDTCVRALKRAGARKVIVACFARVLDEAL